MDGKCPVGDEVKDFDKKKLNRTQTAEKNPLPTDKDIRQEKEEQKNEAKKTTK